MKRNNIILNQIQQIIKFIKFTISYLHYFLQRLKYVLKLFCKQLDLNRKNMIKQTKTKIVGLNQKVSRLKFSIRQKFHQQLKLRARKEASHYNQLANALQNLKEGESLSLYKRILSLLQCDQWKQHCQIITESCLIDFLIRKLVAFSKNARLFKQQEFEQHKILTQIFCCLTEKPQILNIENQDFEEIFLEILPYIQKYQQIQIFFCCLTAIGNLIYYLNHSFYNLLAEFNVEDQILTIINTHLEDKPEINDEKFLPAIYIPNFIWFLKAYFQTYQDQQFRPKFKKLVKLFALQQVHKISIDIQQDDNVFLINQLIGLLNLLQLKPSQIQNIAKSQDFIASLLKNMQEVLAIGKIKCNGLIFSLNYAKIKPNSILQLLKNSRLINLIEFMFQNPSNTNSICILEILVLYLKSQNNASPKQAVKKIQDYIIQIYGSLEKAPLLKSRRPQLLAEFLIIILENSDEDFWSAYLQEECNI